MFCYKDYITLNSNFNKSTNIIYDNEDCKNYIITMSSQNVLKTLFKLNYHNSISLIGPFGCGKSSLLLFINTLLSNNNNVKECESKLKKTNNLVHKEYRKFIDNKKFLRIKIIGEHISFKTQLKNIVLENKLLKKSIKYLKEYDDFSLSKLLSILKDDIQKSEYTDVLFSVDEFGKFIEYGLENINTNDIFELQTLSEFINKQDNFKLLVSLHKSFNEYNSNSSFISYTDWDKIQGRFESIVFKDDYYEMLNIFKETISIKYPYELEESKIIVARICEDKEFSKNINISELKSLFEQVIPIHPYSVLIIIEIFSKYFQNQRSVYSFLFSSEPSAFQEFINTKFDKNELYSLSNLYEYIEYLLRVYFIVLPDSEIWYLSEERLKDNRIENNIQKDIIKTISLVHSFKLSNTIVPNKKNLVLSLIDKYTEDEIISNIKILEKSNLLVFQQQTLSYSLLVDSNINIDKELKNILLKNINFNHELQINKTIKNKNIIAKKYFSEFGSKRNFEKKYIYNNKKELNSEYKIFLVNNIDFDIKKISVKNQKSLFLRINNTNKLHELVERVEALKIIKNDNKDKLSVQTIDIIDNMILDNSVAIDSNLNSAYLNSKIYYLGNEYKFSSKTLQKLISGISKTFYFDTPKINNYMLNHTIVNKGTATTYLKALFRVMLENPEKENLGIIKYPAEKALYLSIIKPSGIHRLEKNKFGLFRPNGLNFESVWDFISKYTIKRVKISTLIEELKKEPFGLDKTKSLFVISLYITVNKDMLNIFRDNTYTFDLSIDALMNIWKVAEKFELNIVKLSDEEQKLFEAYIQIATDFDDFKYTKEKVIKIISTLHRKFNYLPEYARRTQNLSKNAIALRTELLSMREPTKAFFYNFPKALGFENISNIDNAEFIKAFKTAFNEIALCYKEELLRLEKYIASSFLLKTTKFPYENLLSEISEKLSKIEGLDYNSRAILRCFAYSNSIVDLVDGLSMILIRKKLEQCYDNDIIEVKEQIKVYAQKFLSKLELLDITKNNQDIRKISLSSLDNDLNRIISIDKNEIDIINKKVIEMKKLIPTDYTNNQKLYLISQLLNEELNND